MAGPALLHGTDRLGPAESASKSRGTALRPRAVQPGIAFPSPESAALAGAFAFTGPNGACSGYGPGPGNFVAQRRVVLWRPCEGNRFSAVARRASAGGIGHARHCDSGQL